MWWFTGHGQITASEGCPDMLAMRVVNARVIQYFGSQYQSVTAEVEKVWEYTTKMGCWTCVDEKLPVWHGFCCAGTISLAHKKIQYTALPAKCIGKARTSTCE